MSFLTALRGPDPSVAPLVEDLRRYQERIGVLAEMLKSGVEPRHSILGLIQVDARPLSPEARVDTLFELVSCYETARMRLLTQRNLWSECLAHLGPRLSAAVAPRAERLRQLERKRGHLEETARQGSDAELVERTLALGERLETSLRSLAAAVVAILRRTDAVRAARADLGGLDAEQDELLGRLRERAGARAEMLELEREVQAFEEGDARSAPEKGPAGLFDDLFQSLDRGLATALDADDRLQALVRELLQLAADLEDDGARERIGADEMQAGEALLRGPLDDAALLAIALAQTPAAADTAPAPVEPLANRLRKVEVALEYGCLTSFGEVAFLCRARRAQGVLPWREYLSRFPQGIAVEEARRALGKLDAAALGSAERQVSRHGWWSYLRDFPEGQGAAKAREALEKMPPAAGAPETLRRLAACPEGSIFLGDLPALSCQVGSGKLGINEGGEVRVLGERCERFLLPHPPARVRWAIPEGAVRFSAIGTRLDAKEAAHGTWRYELRLDEQSVFQSGPLHDQPEGIPIEVGLPQGSRVLEIVVDDYGNGHYDWAALAYPQFHRAPA